MRLRTLALAFFTAVTLSTLAVGQTPPSVSPASSPVTSTPLSQASESQELIAAKEQIRHLQTQVQMMKEYHGSLLETVYWALGGVFVVVGLLLGFGWFANFKVYERDKQALRDELDAQLKGQNAAINGSFEKLSAESRELTLSEVGRAADQLKGQIASEISKAIDPIKSSISGVGGRVFRLELNGIKEKMISNPSDNMALTDALELLELCKTRAPDELPDTMNFMLKKIDKGGRLTAKEITRVNAVLDDLPAHYKALCDRLRAKLVASDIF